MSTLASQANLCQAALPAVPLIPRPDRQPHFNPEQAVPAQTWREQADGPVIAMVSVGNRRWALEWYANAYAFSRGTAEAVLVTGLLRGEAVRTLRLLTDVLWRLRTQAPQQPWRLALWRGQIYDSTPAYRGDIVVAAATLHEAETLAKAAAMAQASALLKFMTETLGKAPLPAPAEPLFVEGLHATGEWVIAPRPLLSVTRTQEVPYGRSGR